MAKIAIPLLLLLALLVPVGEGQQFKSCDECQKKKVWRIQHGHDWSSYEYINDKGYIDGFSIDLITAVCKEARIDCRLVWDKYTNCIEGTPGERHSGGKGLMSGWYDACTGWGISTNRISFLDYSQAYMKIEGGVFYVKKGNPKGFSADSITSAMKFAFVDGWIYDEQCVNLNSASLGDITLKKDQVMHFGLTQEWNDAIVNGKVDAGFSATQGAVPYVFNDTLEEVKMTPVPCMLQGNSMIMRKGSPFANLWNEGFNKIRANGVFKKICTEANKKEKHGHRGPVKCVQY